MLKKRYNLINIMKDGMNIVYRIFNERRHKVLNNKEDIIQSVERAFNILEELAKESDGTSIAYLASSTGLAKSTIHRMLSTLLSLGYVEKNIDSDKYQLSTKIITLGTSVFERMDIRKIAKPYIEKLSKKTGEVVHLGIIDNGEVVYIDKVESPRSSIRMYSQIGRRAPLYCTGIGKVLLAYLPEDKVSELMKNKELHRYTETTITNIDDLKHELHLTKERGYSNDEMEHEEDIRCVGAPIFDVNGEAVAAISIAGPVLYVTKERMPQLTSDILKTAEDISRQLGFLS